MKVCCRVGDVTKDAVKITVVTLRLSEVSVTCSGGRVAISPLDVRYNRNGKNIAVALVTITDLAAWTMYEYTISQDDDTLSGSFRTLPVDQDTDFGFIVTTCEKELGRDIRSGFSQIRRTMQTAHEPVVMMMHIDDLIYVDRFAVDDLVTGIVQTGLPEVTGVGSDYAAGYAAYYGLIPSYGKYQMEDRQWVYRNLPCIASGGDHAIEGNHCRGGFGNSDYAGCNRGAIGDISGNGYNGAVPNLEATAKAEWDAFVGNANPEPLRENKWHWGKAIGPVRFALFDYSLYSQPHDPLNPDVNLIGYGAEQLGDIRGYMNVDSEPFKCFLAESGFVGIGQPWRDWHVNEADGWKAEFDGTANYMTDGTSFAVYGDVHAPHVVSHDTFWSFCCGLLQDSAMVNLVETEGMIGALADNWGSQLRWVWNSPHGIGRRVGGGYWHFRVFASEMPRRITAEFIDSGSGVRRSDVYTLVEGASNNQWQISRKKF